MPLLDRDGDLEEAAEGENRPEAQGQAGDEDQLTEGEGSPAPAEAGRVPQDGKEGKPGTEGDEAGDRDQAPLEAIHPTPVSQAKPEFAQPPGADRDRDQGVGGVVMEIERLDPAMLVAIDCTPWEIYDSENLVVATFGSLAK